MHKIKSDQLDIVINPLGAELWSIKAKDGIEYLWQGDDSIWGDRAPHIFPFVARLTNDCYTLHGNTYNMDIHGFVKDTQLEAKNQTENSIIFSLKQNHTLKKQYPYDFLYQIKYKVQANILQITYSVENKSNETMFFGLGGHPGFFVPFAPNTEFEDYYLEFDQNCTPQRIGFTDDCFLNGNKTTYKLMDDNKIFLKHELFSNDAIILENTSKSLSIKSKKTHKHITVSFPSFPYLGIWHMPNTEAPYVCIEPWSSLPSRKDIVEDLAEKKDLISLPVGNIYETTWTIEIN